MDQLEHIQTLSNITNKRAKTEESPENALGSLIEKLGPPQLVAAGSGMAAAFLAFTAYKRYTAIQAHFETADYVIPHGKLALDYRSGKSTNECLFNAFCKMRREYTNILSKQEDGIELPLPPFWETEPDIPYQLIHPISRDSVINQYKQIKVQPTLGNLHIYGVAQQIISSLICSLKEQSSAGFLWPEPSRHPYILFAKELLHWASTELLKYFLGSKWAIDQLNRRIEYITYCSNIPYLVPVASKTRGKAVSNKHPSKVIQGIIKALTALSKQKLFIYQEMEFKQDIKTTCFVMKSLIREVLLLQYSDLKLKKSLKSGILTFFKIHDIFSRL